MTELMLGNYTDPDAKLTKKVMGNVCFYKGLEWLIAPTYNPFVLEKQESVLNCFITMIDNEPTIYLETKIDDKLYEKWISIKYGLIVKQLVFDSDGLIVDRKVATSIMEKSIEDYVFIRPSNVDFRDITLMLYSFGDGDTETFGLGIENTIPEDDFSMKLINNQGGSIVVHAGGIDDDMCLDHPIYIYEVFDSEGNALTLRCFRKGEYYYTVCDEQKTVEKYASSCFEQKFFDLVRTGLYGVNESDKTKSYIFYDNQVGHVSGMVDFYEYVIDKESHLISSIKLYSKESILADEIYGDIVEYEITEIGTADESLIDIPEDYKVIDHGENSHNDGEYMPFWYE